ncbi:MAG TPA: carboxypeptidase regulatory-like domain-containing protein [Terracidiphilus sp.]|nr:carboxypeptidase regulatory-like domain-containing protein [Terracidiphilus sp.]
MDRFPTSFRKGCFALHGFKLSAFVFAMALSLAGVCPAVLAQSGAGSIQGTIKDPTGAVIPFAAITVTNHATNVKATTKSNGVGFYQVPGLFTGTYTVTVTARGMKTYNRILDLLAGQTAVINPVMTAGSVTQQVTVSANTIQLVDKDNGAITSTLENARINQLPMNGRSLITLVQETTPGLSSCSQSDSCPNGLFGEAMEYVADGASLANREFGGTHTGQAEMVDPDSVQQVHVETSGSGAQYATPATAVLSTKSGTNQLHGTLFETARNNAFGIARQRQNPSDFAAPPYIRNEFGASAGGPIIIPGLYHGRNKSFWFFAYERYSLRSSSYQNMKVPTPAMRAGDFSQLTDSHGIPETLYDPTTTTSNPKGGKYGAWPRMTYTQEFNEGAGNPALCNGDTNCIPQNMEAPDAKIFMAMTPLPNTTNNPAITTNLSGPKIGNQTAPQYNARVDHVFNDNNRMYIRFGHEPYVNEFNRNDPSDESPTLAVPSAHIPYAASNLSIDATNLYDASIGYTHVFSPTFYSETVLSQTWFNEQNKVAGTPNFNFEKLLGLPNNFGEPGFPWIGTSKSSIYAPMQGTMFQYGVDSIVTDLDENFTKTFGKHQLMFGGRYRHERFGSLPDESKDEINFNGNGTALADPTSKTHSSLGHTGDANADLFIGDAASYSVNIEPPYQHLHDMEFDAYLQDDWHVSTNFTLDVGLRYEAHPALWSKYGMQQSFDLKNHAVVLAATPAQLVADYAHTHVTQAVITNDINNGVKFETAAEAGLPSSLMNNSDFTFGPRAGFAWQLPVRWKTVIRGAYGRYIYPEPIRSYAIDMNKATPFTANYSMDYNSADQAPDSDTNYQTRSVLNTGGSGTGPWTTVPSSTPGVGVPEMGINSAGVIYSNSTTSLLPGYSIYSVDPDYPPNYVTQTNFTVEQPLPGNSALRFSYLYTHANNLDQNLEYNSHYSTYAWEILTGTIPPTGHTVGLPTFSGTALGPYDQTVYGSGSWEQLKSGWSNDNIFQANYQRLFHHGLAYQIEYDFQKPMRLGGNGGRDSNIYPTQNYVFSGQGTVEPVTAGADLGIAPAAPPARPAGTAAYAAFKSLERYQSYMEDTGIPRQHVQFNWILDLPFGKGQKFLGGANRAVNELVGGWQFAGDGSVVSQDFTIQNGEWGPTHPLHVYKHGKKITDCRSGNCYPAYLWFNGYIPTSQISGTACAGTSSKVVTGLPGGAGYLPAYQPIDTVCGDKYYGNNDVNVVLSDGTVEPHVAYQPGPTGAYSGNPYSHTVLNGPMNYSADLSLFKVFPITERTNLRFNLDAFNALNVQGFTKPDTTSGIEEIQPGGVGASSYNSPRELQMTLRLTF